MNPASTLSFALHKTKSGRLGTVSLMPSSAENSPSRPLPIQDIQIQTPTFMLYTRRGCVPHLTSDIVEELGIERCLHLQLEEISSISKQNLFNLLVSFLLIEISLIGILFFFFGKRLATLPDGWDGGIHRYLNLKVFER
ncbi:hypothetical protein BKA69DRAFT_206248 [Paraphysoderma sedebokerense]|nr:hypothetical protein BKA69DRAFT_206248 [Paraphysoderma sedebokerense]